MGVTKQKSFKISKDVVALIFSLHMWGNQRKTSLPKFMEAKGGQMPPEDVAKRVKMSKELIVSKEYVAVCDYMKAVKTSVLMYSIPSFFRESCFLVRVENIEAIDSLLAAALPELKSKIAYLQLLYPSRVDESRKILSKEGLFDEKDYPSADDLASMFYWDYQWVSFDVPDGLPEGIREEAIAKMNNMWNESATLINASLLESFKKLVEHAVDKLSPPKEGEKKKVLHETFIPNINAFLDTFNNRNVTGFKDLSVLVEQARKIMNGVTETKDIKGSEVVQKVIRRQFEKISSELDKMVIEKPRRGFDLRGSEE